MPPCSHRALFVKEFKFGGDWVFRVYGGAQGAHTEGGSKVLTLICLGREARSQSCAQPQGPGGGGSAQGLDAWTVSAPSLRRDRFHPQVWGEGGLAAIWPLHLGGKTGGRVS